MKKVFIILFLLLSVNSFAQQSEIGLSAGISMNSKPMGNEVFRGNRSSLNYSTGLTYLINLNRTFQLGAELDMLELSRRSTYVYDWHEGEPVGNDGKKFDYSHYTFSFAPFLNAKIFKWEDCYVYGGITAGLVVARNYQNTNNDPSPNSSDSYAAADGGIGEMAGVQLGINYSINRRFALNAQGSIRYYNLSYDAEAYYYHDKLAYGAWVYPVMAGLRYNFGFEKIINAKTGNEELKPSPRNN